MIQIVRDLITPNGSIPATIGLVRTGQTIDLMNQPASGFSKKDLQESPKIAEMAFIGPNRLMVAIADYGEFKSASMLVFEINTLTDVVTVLGTYQYDAGISDFLQTVHVSSDTTTIVGGHNNMNIPMLKAWNGSFLPSTSYSTTLSCNKVVPHFAFSFPIVHSSASYEFHKNGYRPLQDSDDFTCLFPVTDSGFYKPNPVSYHILQSTGNHIYAVIAAITNPLDIAVDADYFTAFGVAKFDKMSLALVDVIMNSPALARPDVFEKGSWKAGFIGAGSDFMLQVVGYREGSCGRTNNPLVLDGIVRRTAPDTFNILEEANYGQALGFKDFTYYEMNQGLSGAMHPDLTDFFVSSEVYGFCEVNDCKTYQSSDHVIAMTRNGDNLYVLTFTHRGLRLTLYSV